MCRRILFFVLIFYGISGLLRGQEKLNGEIGNEQAMEWIANMAEEISQQGGEDLAISFVEYYSHLLNNPLKINYASRESLEKLVILTDFQIESILDYRESSGNILSKTELSLLNGFDYSIVCLLSPFLDFSILQLGDENVFGGTPIKKYAHNILLKTHVLQQKQEQVGPPLFLQLRYKGVIKNRFQVGVTLENDAGEKIIGSSGIPFGDFISLHFAARNLDIKNWQVKSLVLGDYAVRFGQGLVVWNSFNMQGNSSVSGLLKRADAVSPYTSSSEYGYFRGVGVTFSRPFKNSPNFIDFSLFFSYNGVDASLKNGRFTSLSADGLHNTESSIKRKMAIREMVWGANVSFKASRFSVGLNCVGYGFDTPNGVKLYDYNRFQQYYGMFGNVSVDFNWLLNAYRVYGEVAFDWGGDVAMVAGVIARSGEWDWGVLARYYSKGYIAPHSGGYSTGSGTYNEAGIAASVLKSFSYGLKFSAGIDGVYYPWFRYNIPSDTYQIKGWGKLEYITDNRAWSVKLYNNYTSYSNTNKVGVKGYYTTNLIREWLSIKPRAEMAYGNSFSCYVAADVITKLCKDKLRLYFRGTYYNCKDWLGRLYIYENDLPMSFSSKLAYGEGLKGYFMAQYKNRKFGSLYFKIDSDLLFKVGLKSDL